MSLYSSSFLPTHTKCSNTHSYNSLVSVQKTHSSHLPLVFAWRSALLPCACGGDKKCLLLENTDLIVVRFKVLPSFGGNILTLSLAILFFPLLCYSTARCTKIREGGAGDHQLLLGPIRLVDLDLGHHYSTNREARAACMRMTAAAAAGKPEKRTLRTPFTTRFIKIFLHTRSCSCRSRSAPREARHLLRRRICKETNFPNKQQE